MEAFISNRAARSAVEKAVRAGRILPTAVIKFRPVSRLNPGSLTRDLGVAVFVQSGNMSVPFEPMED